MLALAPNNVLVKYPCTLRDLQELYPNVMFTLPLEAEPLAEYGVVDVVEVAPPTFDNSTQRLVELDPVFSEGTWTQRWSVVDLTQEEIDAAYNAQANWQQFYGGLLTSTTFGHVQAAAKLDLGVSVAYVDLSNALTLSLLGQPNVPALQASINNLVAALGVANALNETQRSELNNLLTSCCLDRLLTIP